MDSKQDSLHDALVWGYFIASLGLITHAHYEGALGRSQWIIAGAAFVFGALISYSGDRVRQRRKMRYPQGYDGPRVASDGQSAGAWPRSEA